MLPKKNTSVAILALLLSLAITPKAIALSYFPSNLVLSRSSITSTLLAENTETTAGSAQMKSGHSAFIQQLHHQSPDRTLKRFKWATIAMEQKLITTVYPSIVPWIGAATQSTAVASEAPTQQQTPLDHEATASSYTYPLSNTSPDGLLWLFPLLLLLLLGFGWIWKRRQPQPETTVEKTQISEDATPLIPESSSSVVESSEGTPTKTPPEIEAIQPSSVNNDVPLTQKPEDRVAQTPSADSEPINEPLTDMAATEPAQPSKTQGLSQSSEQSDPQTVPEAGDLAEPDPAEVDSVEEKPSLTVSDQTVNSTQTPSPELNPPTETGFSDHIPSDIEAAKFNLGQTEPSQQPLASVDEGLPELPDGYGQTKIVLMPREPNSAYAYWDIPNEDREKLRKQGGEQLALRFYDVTNIDMDQQRPHSVRQYECEEMTREWYIEVPISDRDYIVEIGYVTEAGRWLLLARSFHVRIPPVYPCDWYGDDFRTVNWNDNLLNKPRG